MAPAPAQARKSADLTRVSSPRRDGTSRALVSPDAERTVALLVRATMPRVAAALVITGTDREPALVVAASQLRHLMLEVENLAGTGSDGWGHIAPELGCIVAAHRALSAALRGPAFGDVRREMMQARLAMLKALPAALATRTSEAKATPIATVSASDRVRLARQLLATCRERIAAASQRKTVVNEASAHALCRQLALDVSSATDAALHITDRVDRTSLLPDMNALEERLDWLQMYLSQTPKLRWDRTFASLFDGANTLRKVMGLMPKARAYTGTIDPAAALERAKAIATGAESDMAAAQFGNPQDAVAGIMHGIGDAHKARQAAIGRLASAMAVHDTRRPRPFALRVVLGAIELAISIASAKLGELASKGMERFLVARSTSRLGSNEYLEHLLADGHWMRNVLIGDALKEGAASRAAWSGRAKKGVEKAFDFTAKAVRDSIAASPEVSSTTLLEDYCARSTIALVSAAHATGLELLHLRAPLEQADLEMLNALSQYINGELVAIAGLLQYDHSLKGWLDVEAHDATKTEPDAAVDLIGHPGTPGSVEVKLLVGPEPHERPQMTHMVLHGREPNARRHLRAHPERLRHSKLNVRYVTRYYWGFGGVKDVVRSQDPSGQVRMPALDRVERAVLRLRVAGERMTSGSVHVAEDYYLSHISDAAAEASHEKDIDSLALTTSSIEEP